MANTKQPVKKGIDKSLIILCAVGFIIVAAIVAAIVVLVVGSQTDPADNGYPVEVNMLAVKNEINASQLTEFKETDEVTDYVKITVKDHGDIIVRLREDIAPLTVKNFKELVSEKFYDGLTFHRVVSYFMIQGGDPKGDGSGGSDKKIKGEFSQNGWDNELSHVRGVISMARNPYSMDSASSQFFICTSSDYAESSLDGQYASFGYVVAGLGTVDSIANVEVDWNATKSEKSVPTESIIIEKICFVEKK